MQKIISFVFGVILTFTVFGQEVEEPNGIYNFVPNGGQWPEGVLYKADVSGGKIWLEEKGVLYQFVDNSNVHHADFNHKPNGEPEVIQHLVYAQFMGANENFKTVKENPTREYYNYFLGNDKSKWASDLHGYNKIEYTNLYNNIDLLFFEKEQELKYEYHIKSGGNYKDISIKYKGQDKIKLQENGDVIIDTPIGQITEKKPFVYQIKNGKIVEIKSEFVISKDNELSYSLDEFDESLELIIDPVLVFATYNGAQSNNFGMTATYAYDGKAYSGGTLYGNNYPTPSPSFNTTTNFTGTSSSSYGITDVFITKYSSDGTALLWTSFIGGGDNTQGTETVHSLICDTLNNIYLYGATSSLDFPMQNAYQNVHSGGTFPLQFYQNGVYHTNQGTDIFVSKLSEDGTNLLGSTYVGGSGNDGINYNLFGAQDDYNELIKYDSLTTNYGDQFRGEIMLDSMNNILIASSTRSSDFPVLNGFQPNLGGQQDGVLFKLAANFNSLLWSSYYGGTENDACYSVKIDSSYNILIAGGTSSMDLPNTVGGLNPNYMGGKTDGFVAKVAPNGSSITQSTYIGTANYDQAIFVEIDRWDNVYLVGVTRGNMPIINANYSEANSGQFITKLTPDLTSITYQTIFGNGNGQSNMPPNISPAAFLVDVCGNVYVSGWGGNVLPGSPPIFGLKTTTNAEFQTAPNGYDFYLFVLERDAQSLLYGSYLGGPTSGEHVDGGTSRFDKFGVVYQSVCGGCGGNSDFETSPGAYSAINNSSCNNLVFKFDFELLPHADFTVDNLDGCAPLTIMFDNESNDTINSVWTFSSVAGVTQISGGINPVVEFSNPGTYEVILNITDTICNLQDTAKKVITVYPALQLEVSNDTVLCNNGNTPFNIIANSNGTASSFTWATDINFANVINTGALGSIIEVNPAVTTTYYVTATNGWPLCDLIDSVQVMFLDDAITLMNDTTVCRGDTVNLYAEYTLGGITMFDWSPDTYIYQENQNVAFTTPINSQYYYLTATINGCPFYDSVFVNVDFIDPLTVMATASPIDVPEGGNTTLMAFPDSVIYNYVWFPPNSVESPTSQTTIATINEDTDFVVFVNRGVCTVPAFVSVKSLEFVCGDVYIFVPNAFTPNNDEVNDKVFVRGQNIKRMKFMIFDRWGEVVFETEDQSIGWDGTFKGEKLDPDVYVYHLKVVCVDGQENLIKGNITLLR